MNLINLPEVISERDFHIYLDQLVSKRNSISKNKFVLLLEILGEKFEKFYNDNELSNEEKQVLYEILKELTDLLNFDIMARLIGILFQFRIDNYAVFLQENLQNIENPVILEECRDALKEYYSNHST